MYGASLALLAALLFGAATPASKLLLRELGTLDGDNGFMFGRLHAVEEARGQAALADYRRLRPELDHKRHRRAVSTGT